MRINSRTGLTLAIMFVLMAVVGPVLIVGCSSVPNPESSPGLPVARTAAILNSTADSVVRWDLDQDGFLRGAEIVSLGADLAAQVWAEARRTPPPSTLPSEPSARSNLAVTREAKIPVERTAVILRASALTVARWDLDGDGYLRDAEFLPLLADLAAQIAAESQGGGAK